MFGFDIFPVNNKIEFFWDAQWLHTKKFSFHINYKYQRTETVQGWTGVAFCETVTEVKLFQEKKLKDLQFLRLCFSLLGNYNRFTIIY